MKTEQHTCIAEALRAAGLTLTDLAQRLDVTPASVHQYIHGNPTINVLARIADVLGCRIKDLIRD
jgi:transcriptional regulator with XRE-family HTH domain